MMPYYYSGYDYTYFIYVIPALFIALMAQILVKSSFHRYAKVLNARGISGAQAARFILNSNGVFDVRIEQTRGNLSDHFDPRAKVIRLSEQVYHNHSIAAIGVAAHEAGHALQYAEGYLPIRFRNAFIPISNFGSLLSWPLILCGFVLSFSPLIVFGIILFSTVTVLQLLTLPVEFNASRRALAILKKEQILAEDELFGARRVLTAAAMTYVAALLVSIMQLLRLLVLFSKKRR